MIKSLATVIFLLSALLTQAQVPDMGYSILPTPAEMKFGDSLLLMSYTISIYGNGKGSIQIIPGKEKLKLYSSILKRELRGRAAEGIFYSIDYSLIKYNNQSFYEITIEKSGVYISLASEKALIHALQTLRQLFIYTEGKT